MSDKTGLLVQTVAFGDNGIEITYLEVREQSQHVGMIRTMLYEVDEQWRPRVEDLMDSLEEIIEDGLVKIRNPQFNTRKTAQERSREIGRQRAEAVHQEDADYDPEVDGKEYGD